MRGWKATITMTLATASCFLAAGQLWAGGYEWFGLGSRASAMGGAFIGLADDWTAPYWNPAGLAQLEGSGVGVDGFSPHASLKGSNSFANLMPSEETINQYQYDKNVFLNYSGVEPDRFNKTSSTYHFYHPQGAGAYYSFPEFTLGLTIYSPLGYYSDWKDTIPYAMGSIYGKNYQKLAIIETQFTIAREIAHNLFAGVGVALLYDQLERKTDKIVSDSQILDYRYKFSLKDDGFGAEGMAGLLYRICDMVSVGGVYRTGATVRMTGDSHSSLDFMGLNESKSNTYRFRHPPTWGIGVAVTPMDGRLTLTADFQQTLWGFYRTSVQYKEDGMLLMSSSFDEDWRDSNRYRIGAEYMLEPKWALRAGFAFDESPLPDKSVSLAHIPDVDRSNITVGTGFEMLEDLTIDLLVAYGWGSRKAEGARYELDVWAFGLDLSYQF